MPPSPAPQVKLEMARGEPRRGAEVAAAHVTLAAGSAAAGAAGSPVPSDGAAGAQQAAACGGEGEAAAAAAAGQVRPGAAAGSGCAEVVHQGSQHQQLAPELSAASSVDISELSWGDRERVLRLLFSKINDQARQHR
jgi:hypothetical protein